MPNRSYNNKMATLSSAQSVPKKRKLTLDSFLHDQWDLKLIILQNVCIHMFAYILYKDYYYDSHIQLFHLSDNRLVPCMTDNWGSTVIHSITIICMYTYVRMHSTSYRNVLNSYTHYESVRKISTNIRKSKLFLLIEVRGSIHTSVQYIPTSGYL